MIATQDSDAICRRAAYCPKHPMDFSLTEALRITRRVACKFHNFCISTVIPYSRRRTGRRQTTVRCIARATFGVIGQMSMPAPPLFIVSNS